MSQFAPLFARIVAPHNERAGGVQHHYFAVFEQPDRNIDDVVDERLQMHCRIWLRVQQALETVGDFEIYGGAFRNLLGSVPRLPTDLDIEVVPHAKLERFEDDALAGVRIIRALMDEFSDYRVFVDTRDLKSYGTYNEGSGAKLQLYFSVTHPSNNDLSYSMDITIVRKFGSTRLDFDINSLRGRFHHAEIGQPVEAVIDCVIDPLVRAAIKTKTMRRPSCKEHGCLMRDTAQSLRYRKMRELGFTENTDGYNCSTPGCVRSGKKAPVPDAYPCVLPLIDLEATARFCGYRGLRHSQ